MSDNLDERRGKISSEYDRLESVKKMIEKAEAVTKLAEKHAEITRDVVETGLGVIGWDTLVYMDQRARELRSFVTGAEKSVMLARESLEQAVVCHSDIVTAGVVRDAGSVGIAAKKEFEAALERAALRIEEARAYAKMTMHTEEVLRTIVLKEG